ncbi:Ppx/GppA phosphatase family protein [Thalassotalea sp. PLHSN55]|uniref:Ppx/GppA phosphatase family protein n=1 Tax=Thalassotalea sp. PLHSN55 TaxID=3435888 RepID=UPI003F845257
MSEQNPQTSATPENVDTSPEKFLAALDIGSNSFHYVYARLSNDNLQVLHTEKYQVKLASGLDDNHMLSDEAISRGVATLENLLSSTENLTAENFRVVATYTLRKAKNAKRFLQAAKKVFPFDIEVISGHEEARLIYQGVAHNSESSLRQLIIDIGGGSTECVIGEGFDVKALASLNIGCVSCQKAYFPDENISSKHFKKAINEAKYKIEPLVKRFQKKGWQAAIGTSGTIKAIYNILNYDEAIKKPITLKQLQKLKSELIKAQTTANIKLAGLKENRRELICSGVAILIALFEMLGISELDFCSQALREGVLYQQLDKIRCDDIKQRTIGSLGTRFTIDQVQADNVSQLATTFFEDITKKFNFTDSIYQELLQWSAQIHEIGTDINTGGYQKHGEYILNNAHLSGFNQEQQQALAWLVGNQRKKISDIEALEWYMLDPQSLLAICIILRLSVLLNQQRHLNELPPFNLAYKKKTLYLHCEQSWLLERPLVDTELFHEQQYLEKVGITLAIEAHS